MDKKGALKHLFDGVNKKPLEYMFALLRVGWIESYEEDPLLNFRKTILNKTALESDDIDLQSARDFWSLVANLSRISGGEDYRPDIFFTAETDQYMTEAINLVHYGLADYLKGVLPSNWDKLTKEQRREAQVFISEFFNRYEEVLKDFIGSPQYIKLPGFEVLELLTHNKKGLFGFKIHFSNGSHAEFKRDSRGAQGINLMPSPGRLTFNVGMIDDLKHEWVVGDRKLFEIGVPGRYNRPGEWMPIIYPGESRELQKEAIKLADGDEQAEGVYFYLLCTGYWCIEFAIKTPIDLPQQVIGLPGDVMLYKVDSDEKFQSEFVYDGAYYLENYELETIQKGIQKIQRAMNGIALAFDKPIHWELKYSIRSHSPGSAAVKPKDNKFLDKLVQSLQARHDLYIDAAVDWYQRGLASNNIFNSFICFHIAIEGLAIKMISGELVAGKNIGITDKFLVKAEKVNACIQECFDNYYSSDPTLFATRAYLDCVQSLKTKIKTVLEKVFGEDHKYLKEYFDGKESLWNLRGELVHEAYSDWHFDKKELIRKKSYLLQDIAKEFLIRIIQDVKPGEKAPSWSKHFMISMSMFSPKGALVASDPRIFPTKDWKIKASWIESK